MSKRDPMSVVGSATLLLELVVIALAIPFAIRAPVEQLTIFLVLCSIAMILAVAGVATMRKSVGVWLGWATQACVIAAGFVSLPMLVVALMFTSLWITAIWVARRVKDARQ